MLRKRGGAFLACLLFWLAVSIPLAGCRPDSPLGKGFRFPLAAEPRQLDPQVSTDAASVALISALFEGLTRLDEAGNAVPAAAEWTVSGDGLTYTFRLKESYWSTLSGDDRPDGSADSSPFEEPQRVTAQDFVFGMQRAVSPQTGSPLASQLFIIQNAQEVNEGKRPVSDLAVRAVDEDTLTITLTQPDPEFPERLAGTPFLPCNEAFFTYTAGRYGLEKEYVLTNGPFLLTAWNHGESLLLNKNENFHEQEDVYPSSVRYVIGSAEDSGDALLAGSLDAAELAPSRLSQAREENFQLTALSDTIEYVWLNNSLRVLSSAPIRRALRDSLAWDILSGQFDTSYCSPAQGYVPPAALLSGSEAYRTAENARLPATNADKARQSLAEGLAELELTEMPVLKVLCADDDYSANLGRYIIQSWQSNLSLYFQLDLVPASELSTRVRVGNYQIAICAQTGSSLYASGLLASFLSTAESGNLAQYSSAEYDALYASCAEGGFTRADIDRLEQKLVEDCPSIPLDFQKRFYGMPETVSGILIRPFGGGAYGACFDFRHAGKLE